MKNFDEELDAARAKVAHCRIRAERPGSRLEDDFALEKARNRLLTLELRQLKCGQQPAGQPAGAQKGPARSSERMRTKREQFSKSARDRAEEAFATLRRSPADKQERI